MNYYDQLDTCKNVNEALTFYLNNVVNIRLRAILIRGAAGIKEDPLVFMREELSLFIECVGAPSLRKEIKSRLMSDDELDAFNNNLIKSLEEQRERYVLLGKSLNTFSDREVVMPVTGDVLPC